MGRRSMTTNSGSSEPAAPPASLPREIGLTGSIVIASYILLAPYLYRFLFPAYVVAIPYSQIYAVSLISMIANPAVSYLSAKKKIREQYIRSISIFIFQIIIMALGVIYWGLFGLIIARVIIRFFGSCLSYILYRTSVRMES